MDTHCSPERDRRVKPGDDALTLTRTPALTDSIVKHQTTVVAKAPPPLLFAARRHRRRQCRVDLIENRRVVDGGRHGPGLVIGDLLDGAA